MGSDYTNVRLTDEAYELLKSHKQPDESFSEVVARLARERPLTDLEGVFSADEVDAVRAARSESYDDYAEDRERRWRE